MSFDAVTGIAQAENAAKVAVDYAGARAKQLIAEAEEAGKQSVTAACEKAESELKQLRCQAEAKAEDDAVKARGKIENKKAVLRAAAEARLNAAASLVVERIVKG